MIVWCIIIAVLLVYMLALATVFALSVNKISAMPAIQIPQTQGTNYFVEAKRAITDTLWPDVFYS